MPSPDFQMLISKSPRGVSNLPSSGLDSCYFPNKTDSPIYYYCCAGHKSWSRPWNPSFTHILFDSSVTPAISKFKVKLSYDLISQYSLLLFLTVVTCNWILPLVLLLVLLFLPLAHLNLYTTKFNQLP